VMPFAAAPGLDELFDLADLGAGPVCARRPGGVKGI
jgi:hypothetical protein